MGFKSSKTLLLFVFVVFTLQFVHSLQICQNRPAYGLITTIWNDQQMIVCMERSQIIKNCQLYRSLTQTYGGYSVTSRQVECIQQPQDTFLATLIQGGQAFVPNSQRVNYCQKYTSVDDSQTEFMCMECQTEFRLNFMRICTEKIAYCIDYDNRGNCVTCDKYYQLMGSSCIPFIIQSDDPNCQRWDREGRCVRCKVGYVLAGEKCYHGVEQATWIDLLLGACLETEVRTPLGKCVTRVENCRQYDQTLGHCDDCEVGYRFSDNLSECIASVLDSEKLCPRPVDSRTLYKIVNGKCVQVDVNCRDYIPMESTCIECREGYFSWGGRCYFIDVLSN